MRNNNIYKLSLSALLCAIGIVIPLISPFRIVLEPASFTLGSHIAMFIAMFISPGVALAVALGTTVGFFFGGFPVVVVLRAASHVLFALLGATALQKKPEILNSATKSQVFSFFIAILHAVSEVIVSSFFYFGNGMTEGYYAKGFLFSILGLVGLGTVLHSMIDFTISLVVWKAIVGSKSAIKSLQAK